MKLTALLLTALMLSPRMGFAEAASSPGAFADWLMTHQRFHDAEVEYERLALAAGPAETLRWAGPMFAAAWAMEDPRFVLNLSRAWETRPATRCLSHLQTAQALYALRNYSGAGAAEISPECSMELRDDGRYVAGLSLLREKKWRDAGETFHKIQPPSSLSASAAEAAARSSAGPHLRFLSPGWAAGLNALIPGAGYAYAGRPQTAVAALTVTGLAGWGAASTSRSGDKGLAALLSLIALGWYAGGIYGGAAAANRENDRRLEYFISPLELHFQ